MKKFFYILPTLFIETPGMAPNGNVMPAFLHFETMVLQGYFLFLTKKEKGAKKEVSLSVRLELIGTRCGEGHDFLKWSETLNTLTKNYRGISDVLGAAFLNGLLFSE